MAAPVSSQSERMVAPPLPITSRILLASILRVVITGAFSEIVSRPVDKTLFI
jgi:hypothetical protein